MDWRDGWLYPVVMVTSVDIEQDSIRGGPEEATCEGKFGQYQEIEILQGAGARGKDRIGTGDVLVHKS